MYICCSLLFDPALKIRGRVYTCTSVLHAQPGAPDWECIYM